VVKLFTIMQWLTKAVLGLTYYCNFDICDNFEMRKYIGLAYLFFREPNVTSHISSETQY